SIRMFGFIVDDDFINFSILIEFKSDMVPWSYFNNFRIITCNTNITTDRQKTNGIQRFIFSKHKNLRTETNGKFTRHHHCSFCKNKMTELKDKDNQAKQ